MNNVTRASRQEHICKAQAGHIRAKVKKIRKLLILRGAGMMRERVKGERWGTRACGQERESEDVAQAIACLVDYISGRDREDLITSNIRKLEHSNSSLHFR